jgi:hypothetical protein
MYLNYLGYSVLLCWISKENVYRVSLHPIFVKYDTKLTMVNIVILKRAGYRIWIVSMLFLFVSRWGTDDSVWIQHLFVELRYIKWDIRKFHIRGRGSYFHFQMADLPCFLIIGVKYLEIESINPMKTWSC